MKTTFVAILFFIFSLTNSVASTAVAAATKKIDSPKIDQITGMTGTLNEKENVYKLRSPSDSCDGINCLGRLHKQWGACFRHG